MIRKIGLAGLAAVVVLAMAATASAQTLRGTVVHRNARAHSFVIANAHGMMAAVHSRRALKPGRVVSVNARRLRNGTFALRSARVLGRSSHARIRGTVTFAKRGEFVVSDTGTSVLVKDTSGSSQTPPVGTNVQVDGTIDDQGDIQEQDVQQTGNASGNMKLEGTVLSVDQTARTLSISADDDNQSGSALTVDVPQTFDITQFSANQEVELLVTPNSDGTFTLVSSSEDNNSGDANNQSKQQGDDGQSDQTDQGDQQDQQQSQSQDDDQQSQSQTQSGDGQTQTQTQDGQTQTQTQSGSGSGSDG